jgi:hypothetical protein
MVIYVPHGILILPYISRFVFNFTAHSLSLTFPSCSSYYTMLLQYDYMMEFFFETAFTPYDGSSHTIFGGMLKLRLKTPILVFEDNKL